MAVGRLRDRIARGEHSRCAGLVLDHHPLLDDRAQLIGDETRGDVGRAAGSEADNQPDRALRISLRLCGCRDRRDTDTQQRSTKHSHRDVPSHDDPGF
jgi:hypothetical protein